LAQRELTPSLTVNASPRIPSSVKGYVAGMPNDHTKRVMDLTARYKLAIDTAIDYEKIAASEAEPQDVRDFNAGLALLERERAAQIEKDLAALG
jgi:hypothetical protein